MIDRGKTICGARLGLLFLGFACLASWAGPAAIPANYDESKAGSFTLVDPLILKNGQTVTTTNDWFDLRRPEILGLYNGYIFGRSPDWRNILDHKREMDPDALGGKALRKQVDLEFYNYGPRNPTNDQPVTNLTLHVLLYTPAGTRKPVATFLCLSFLPNYREVDDTNVFVYPVWNNKTDREAMPTNVVRGDAAQGWPVAKILARGYGIAMVDYEDIEPDLADGTGWKYGVRSLYLQSGQTNFDADGWGAISAWAWGVSRVMDYLQTDREVDGTRVILLGHSRLGKVALWAGAQDTRFAMVIANCSGQMGAALSHRDYGETLTSMCGKFPWWFCPNFLDYSNDVSDLPVDSQMLLSLIAPRPLFLNAGSEDRWGDPRGVYEAAIAATPVYHLFGEEGVITNLPPDALTNNDSGSLLDSATLESYGPPPLNKPIMHDLGFNMHDGGHAILPSDWDVFLDFADKFLPAPPPPPAQ